MVFGTDFFWVVLQFGAWMRGPGFKIGLFGNCHAANGVSPEVFPDQFVWIAVGQECATTYGPINNLKALAARPVAVWDGEPKQTSIGHNSFRDEP